MDKQNKEITIEEAGVRKDQERDELEITIEKAEVMKDRERVKSADIGVQNEEISQQEDKQTKEITIEKAEMMEDQERVEQAVREAQNAVKPIKMQHLEEERSKANPPHLIRAVTVKGELVPSINNFNTDNIMDDSKKIGARGSTKNRKGNMAATMKEMFVTMARVYYLLAGPWLAEALDSSTVVPLTGSAHSTPKPLTISKPLHSQLKYAGKHEQITTQPWSHCQTKDLLAFKLVTQARVYYLLAGPRLAEALDSITVVPLLKYAKKHKQITTQPWSHRQTKDLIAVKLITQA